MRTYMLGEETMSEKKSSEASHEKSLPFFSQQFEQEREGEGILSTNLDRNFRKKKREKLFKTAKDFNPRNSSCSGPKGVETESSRLLQE